MKGQERDGTDSAMEGEKELPLAWWMAIRYCPYCSGTGCLHCEDTGDLFGSLLRAAYQLGQEDSAVLVRSLADHADAAREQIRSERVSVNLLKTRLHL